MEFSISDEAAKEIGLDSVSKARIVKLVHQYLGLASTAYVTLVHDPVGVKVQTANGSIILNRALTQRIDE
jgi:hypothetical protein